MDNAYKMSNILKILWDCTITLITNIKYVTINDNIYIVKKTDK